ncbi:MAG: Stp1/IreP family PP2C-type Ser/Thr phosphatase [Vicinamibacteria bacterium]|nr:Stp1/IreP family PP2C-type Ser/Thr phosphatase [Vicinamibacteria bacterium]
MIDAVGRSDVGRRRKLNEDSFYVNDAEGCYAVCDGMGGHNAGEIASQLAIETLAAFIKKSDRESEITWPYGLDVNLSFAGNRLTTAIRLANKRVFRAADSREEYTGMGTTVVAALVTQRVLTIGSAGDSRCYLVRHENLTQLTQDDSWVAVAQSEGILGPDDVEHHPFRNVITKAVGAKETIDVEIVEKPLEQDDLILLCSDGLHSMLSDEQIRHLLVPCPDSLEEAAKGLIDAANQAGGRDNVTVVLARIS